MADLMLEQRHFHNDSKEARLDHFNLGLKRKMEVLRVEKTS